LVLEENFWDDNQRAQQILRKISELKEGVESYNDLFQEAEYIRDLLLMAQEENDPELIEQIANDVEKLQKDFQAYEMNILFSGPQDENNAIISLHPGAGGTESQDWGSMLLRMYTRWAEKSAYQVEILDYLPGDEAGIKSVTLLIKGKFAYGKLKCESGVHRLIRISPFDSSGRRHTSFTSLSVLPEIDDEVEVDINPEDLRIDTYRSGGAGGQHVNKTDSAVRITHIPTGIVVQCQNERSQHSNKFSAMKILKARLYNLKQKELEENLQKIQGEYKEIAWGSQIRTYTMNPFSLVKDHRTGVETGNVQAVMDGELDDFISAFLQLQHQKGKKH
jgi:peptide chain release factor 2